MISLSRGILCLRTRLIVPFLLLSVTLGACFPNKTVNRIVDDYWDKAYVNSNWETGQLSEPWYYRLTVVDTPVNTKAASVGDGHWLHPETIRWEITKDYLIGWRAHSTVPGAERDLEPGVNNYRGAPVAVFEITSHFDAARDYDVMTGEKGNVISEDTDSRSWSKRRFMKVDWSSNIVASFTRSDSARSRPLEDDAKHVVERNNPADPKRYRFEKGYFEVTTRQGIKADPKAVVGYYGEAFQFDSASPVVDMRMSFMKKGKRDYEALHYPDYVNQHDENARSRYDANSFSVKVPIWEKFGFYRAAFEGQQTWDQKRGSVESNKNYNITRFNVWKKTYRSKVGEDGTSEKVLIPLEERDPKPIVYFTNVLHPENLMNASRRVESQWNQAFKEFVFYAQPNKYESINDVPDMFILHENSCNIRNVTGVLDSVNNRIRTSVLTAAGEDLNLIAEQIQHANRAENKASYTSRFKEETGAKQSLEKICSALEYFTQGLERPFQYEREGDLRYNLFNLITNRALTSWSGLGPMFADSISGEIIQSTANVNLWYIDYRAARASEQIDLMMGNINLKDVVFATDVEGYMKEKLAHVRAEARQLPSEDALEKMGRHFSILEESGSLLMPISPVAVKSRLEMIKGSSLEKKLFLTGFDEQNDEFLYLQKAQQVNFDAGSSFEQTDQILDQISPARGADLAQRFLKREQEIAKSAHLFADPPEFVDNMIVGVAFKYRKLDRKERFLRIREDIYTAVMLHEVGHNIGLTHNMSASADPLNYGKHFWEIENLPKDPKEALTKASDPELRHMLQVCIEDGDIFDNTIESLTSGALTTQDCLRQSEVMYSSIMDYHASWNADLGGLGMYDRAAVKFGYGQLLEVMPKENLRLNAAGKEASRWLFLNDWRKIPTDLVDGVDGIFKRDHVKFVWDKTSTQMKVPENEVPYLFCLDSSGAYGPHCKAFDYGPDLRTRAEYNNTRYWQHYFMTHFSRDRLWSYHFDLSSIIRSDMSVMNDFNHIMNWYYFYKAFDKEFSGSDAEKDYLAATVMGLNHYVRVLGHPLPGEHVSVPSFMTDSVLNHAVDNDRTQSSDILVPYGKVNACIRQNVVETFQGVPVVAKPGFRFVKVPLGEGRPFFMGLNKDYEDWHINYVGSLLTKLAAGFFLANPGAFYPRTDELTDPRFYNVSWYRLFPNEVGGIFEALIANNLSELGPLVSPEGKLVQREILDPVTLEKPDYTGHGKVLPTASSMMPYRSLFYATSLLSGNMGPEMDMAKMMRVSLRGGEDDMSVFDGVNKKDVETFVHPIQGYHYRALKVGDHPIAFNTVKSLNRLKDKYLRLENCSRDKDLRESDKFCHCVQTSVVSAEGKTSCCGPTNPVCPAIGLQPVGKGSCTVQELNKRKEEASKKMESMVNFLDDMRWFVKKFSEMP